MDLAAARVTLLTARRDYQAVAAAEIHATTERIAIMERRQATVKPHGSPG